jgi:hypothetical protein
MQTNDGREIWNPSSPNHDHVFKARIAFTRAKHGLVVASVVASCAARESTIPWQAELQSGRSDSRIQIAHFALAALLENSIAYQF